MVFSWFKKRGQKLPESSGSALAETGKTQASATPDSEVALAKAANPLALAAAAVLDAPDTEQAQQALQQLQDPLAITYVALQQPELRDAALALPQMRSEEALHAMEKQSRERNKGINRFARTALERIKVQRRDAAALSARGEELNQALGKHNEEKPAQNLSYEQRVAVVQQLQAEYQNNLSQYQQVSTELAQCDIQLAPFPELVVVELPEPPSKSTSPTPSNTQQQLGAHAELEAQNDAPSPEDTEQIEHCSQLLQGLRALRNPVTKQSSKTDASPAAFADLMTQLPTLQQQWQSLQPLGSSPELAAAASNIESELTALGTLATACVALDELAQSNLPTNTPARPEFSASEFSDANLDALSQYQDEIKAATKSLQQQLRSVSWPKWAQTSAAISAPFALRDKLQAEQLWLNEQQQALSGQLASALDVLTQSLDDGQASQSKSQMGKARRLKQAIGKLDPNLSARFNTLSSRLTELVDWQTFATTPKRQELLDAMTQLVDAPLAPEAQANRVKQLRAQWNELGSLSKSADRRLAERFNAQAQTAFDHCREHFAEQAAQRAANSEQREQICQQLSEYIEATDIQHGDVKAAEQILRTARDAWRQCYPVERKTAKPLEKKFEALQQQLFDKIKAVWSANEAAKQKLVETAQALAVDSDADLSQRINQAKDLQKQWQQVGPMPRGGERKLWLAFREACDALFSERDGAKQEQQAAEQEALNQLTAKVDAFATQVELATPKLASVEQLRAVRKDFNDIQGNIPSKSYQPVKRRFDALCKDYELLLQKQQREALRQRIDDLASWDRATTEAGSDAPVPEAADPKLLQGLAVAPSQAPTLDSLQRLVLITEILAEVPSPPADEALRLQVQVERLQENMGRTSAAASPPSDSDWIELALQWCAQRPKPNQAEVAELHQRYFAAVRSALTIE